MIQPEAYYAAHKRCRTPEELGRLGFIIVGRGEELAPPASALELSFAETLMECNEWHTEKREEIKTRARDRKRRSRANNGAEQNGGDAPSNVTDVTDVTVTSVTDECHSDKRDGLMSQDLSIYLPNYLSISPNGDVITRARNLPTEDEMKIYAKQIGAEGYLGEFVKIMESQDWSYINPSGHQVPVGKMNFKTVLGIFHRQEKRNAKGNRAGGNRNEPYHESGLADDIGV